MFYKPIKKSNLMWAEKKYLNFKCHCLNFLFSERQFLFQHYFTHFIKGHIHTNMPHETSTRRFYS